MKKQWVILLVALLVALPFFLWGCGGDDDPTDPPVESCAITVTTPAVGDAFVPGDVDNQTVRIRWDKSGNAPTVSIELLKSGALVDVIAASVNNSGFFQWIANNLGAANGSDFAIRVTALGEDDCLGISGQFSLTSISGCSIAFTNEFDGEIPYLAGNTLTLTWDSGNTLGNVSVELWRMDDNAAPVGFINEAPIDDDGSYDWTIDSLNSGTYDFYYLKILANGVVDCIGQSPIFAMVDEDVCSIALMSPQPGDVWNEGQIHDIDITNSADVTEVSLRLYNGAVFLGTIHTNVLVADLPYAWTVLDFGNETGNSSYRVRAISVDDQYCVGESEAFTIISQQ